MSRWMLLVTVLVLSSPGLAQVPADGLTLISPNGYSESWLIELDGTVVQTFHHDGPHGRSSYRLDDGSLLLPVLDPAGQFPFGGAGGRIQRIDPTDTVVWDFLFSDADFQQHHDIEPMPNGNVLLIAWERKTAAEAEARGKTNLDGDEMWPTALFEIQPDGATGGTIVWEWHLWDHLIQDVDPAKPDYGVIADHPERVDINLGTASNGSWDHANSVDYDPVRDEIVMSCHRLGEILVIDHSTTSAEAAGHTGGNHGRGGDILYRWGNPANYGAPGARRLFGVHGANWIDPGMPGQGNILLYNNGNRDGSLNDNSSAEEVIPMRDANGHFVWSPGTAFGPPAANWIYNDPGVLFSPRFGSAIRMPNGNTLISEGIGGRLLEVTLAGDVVWEHSGPTDIFMARRYFEDPSVPTLVVSSSASWEGDHVRLTATLTAADPGLRVEVHRRDSGPFRPIATQVTWDGPRLEVRDASAPDGTSAYRIQLRDEHGTRATVEESVVVPHRPLSLGPIRPNPFNPRATVEFRLPTAGELELAVFDVRGRRVVTLATGGSEAGTFVATWDGRDADGRESASGTYFFRLWTDAGQQVRKAVLVR